MDEPKKKRKPLKQRKPLRQKTPLRQRSKLKSTKPLAQRSEKMENTYVERREFVKQILTERPYCEACKVFAKHDGLAVCRQNHSQDVHELVRRSQGGSILDAANVLAVCRKCHTRIGNYPQLAFDLGLAKHGWERDK